MLDNLCINKIHTQLATALDPLSSSELSNLARNYLLSCKVEGKSPKTIETYSMVIKRYAYFAGDDSPTATQVREFLLVLQVSNLNPFSVRIYYRSLKTFFNWLVSEELIEKSPMQNMKSPKVPKTIIKPFSQGDIANLLLLCSGTKFLDLRNRAIILVFYDSGVRLSELAGMQIRDINFDMETIKVFGKGAKERLVGIGKTTQKAIIRYLLMRRDDHDCLWVTEERRPMKRDGIQTTIVRLCKRAGVTDAKPGPHTFRHTFATTALRNGARLIDVQSLLGHSTLTMTRKYAETLNSEDALVAYRRFSPVDHLKIK